ncbi:O-antigen polymerase [Rhodococcoides corynebacterioides]|uniref:O-antigen polymerase n=1 Tax=Rhodococcoides corynebacterioides TaxID=53972 RepID=UPI003F8100AC
MIVSDHSVVLGLLGLSAAVALSLYAWIGRRSDYSGAIIALFCVIVIYTLGILDRRYPVFGINVSDGVGGLVLLGTSFLALGAVVPALLIRQKVSRSREFLTSSKRLAASCMYGFGVAIAIVNYATGDIPLLADDVNASRFGSNFGVLGPLWPVSIAIMQASIVVFTIKLLRREQKFFDWGWAVLATVLLALSGGRSLLGLAVLASIMAVVQTRRPRFSRLLLTALVGAAAFGVYGMWRTKTSDPELGAGRYLRQRGLDNWFGSVDLSMQTGPRVMNRLVESGVAGNGRFILGDLGSFLKLGYQLSDRYATLLLGGDVEVVGGLPPTIFGGFYLDWGTTGVIIGSFAVGSTLWLSVYWYAVKPGYGSLLWLSYFLAYLVTSSYSYISFKPTWITVLAVAIVLNIPGRASTTLNLTGVMSTRQAVH